MDPIKYIEGQKKGTSGVVAHGKSTYLIKWDGRETGMQKQDVLAMRAILETRKAAAIQAVLDAGERELAKAGEKLAAINGELTALDEVLAAMVTADLVRPK